MQAVVSDVGDSKRKRTGQWTAEEVAREQAVGERRISRARARGAEANLKEAAALARFANRVAAAAETARRHDEA